MHKHAQEEAAKAAKQREQITARLQVVERQRGDAERQRDEARSAAAALEREVSGWVVGWVNDGGSAAWELGGRRQS